MDTWFFESVILGVWRLQCIIHLRPPVSFGHNYHCHVLCQPHHEIFTGSATFLVVPVFFTHNNASFAAILVTERVCYKYYAKVRLGKLRPNAFVRRTDAWVSRMRHTGALFPLAIAYTSLKQNFSNIISSFSLIYTYWTRRRSRILLSICLPIDGSYSSKREQTLLGASWTMMKLFSGLIQSINQTLPPSCVVSQAVFAKWFGITELVFLREGWWETENGELKQQKHNYSHSASGLSEKEK